MNFCCESFERRTRNHGKRGVSVGAKADALGSPMFYLVMRWLDESDEPVLQSALSQVDLQGKVVDCSYAEQVVIRFCPWCGSKLSRSYRKTWSDLGGLPLTYQD